MAVAEERPGGTSTYDQRRAADLEAARLAELQRNAAPGLGVGGFLPQQWYPSQKPWNGTGESTPPPPPVAMASAPAPAPAPAPAAAPAPMAQPAYAPAPAPQETPLLTPDGQVYGVLTTNAQGRTVVKKRSGPRSFSPPTNAALRQNVYDRLGALGPMPTLPDPRAMPPYPVPPGFERMK